MPIVGGAFSTITVEIQGKINDITSKVDALDKSFDQFTAKTNEANAASAKAAQTAEMSWTDFRSMYSTVLDVVRGGQEVWQATAEKFIDYATEIQKAQRQLGLGVEDAARMIQIADKVGTSYDKISAALGIAQKKGIDVSIQGMERLSDEYLKLAPGTERAQFAAEKFGRGWQAIVPILEKGSGTLDKLNGSIEKGLIPTEAAVKEAEQYKISVKELNDVWNAFIYKVSPGIISATTAIVNQERDWARAREIANEKGISYIESITTRRAELLKQAAAERESADANQAMTNAQSDVAGATDSSTSAITNNQAAVEAATTAYDDYKKKLDEVSQANTEAASFTQKYADFQQGYAKNMTSANDALSKAVAGGNKDEIDKAQKGVLDLETTWHESTTKMVNDMVLAKLSVDGLTDAEYKAYQQQLLQSGQITQAEADKSNALMDSANAIVDGINKQENVLNEHRATQDKLLALEQDKKDATNQTTTATVDGASKSAAAIDSVTQSTRTEISEQQRLAQAAQRTAAAYAAIRYSGMSAPAPSGGALNRRDSGGPGITGEAYVINPIAAPEIFVPSENGAFYPNADKLGSSVSYNIVVNNPNPERASDSIQRVLKNLNYLGLPA